MAKEPVNDVSPPNAESKRSNTETTPQKELKSVSSAEGGDSSQQGSSGDEHSDYSPTKIKKIISKSCYQCTGYTFYSSAMNRAKIDPVCIGWESSIGVPVLYPDQPLPDGNFDSLIVGKTFILKNGKGALPHVSWGLDLAQNSYHEASYEDIAKSPLLKGRTPSGKEIDIKVDLCYKCRGFTYYSKAMLEGNKPPKCIGIKSKINIPVLVPALPSRDSSFANLYVGSTLIRTGEYEKGRELNPPIPLTGRMIVLSRETDGHREKEDTSENSSTNVNTQALDSHSALDTVDMIATSVKNFWVRQADNAGERYINSSKRLLNQMGKQASHLSSQLSMLFSSEGDDS